MKLPRLLGALLVAANLPAFAAALPAPATSDPDLELTLEAKLALFGGLGREALPIDVDSSSGLVTLHGDVCTSASREKAQTMVAALAGVTGVVDLLTVSRDEDAADLGLVRDDALAADVSEALLAEAVPFSGVTVTSVKQGSVALEGGVRCLSDAVAVLRAALRVPGVHAVQSRVRIAGPDGLAQDELVSACASRRGLSSGLRDAWLVRDVKQRLASAAGVSPAVRVDSVDGIVTLFGVVGSEEERQAASAAARAVPGVREVREALSVQSVAGAAPPAAPEEQGLAALVREALARERQHLSQQALAAIRIDVKQGVVRLQGDVPRSSDRVLAGTLTRSVDGVSAVRNELTVSAEEPPDHLDGGLVKN